MWWSRPFDEPKLECFVRQDHEVSATSAERLVADLADLVGGLLHHDDCFAIVEVSGALRYVQVLAHDGGLAIETVSNESLRPRVPPATELTGADRARLAGLRWSPPDEKSPNWYRHWRPGSPAPVPSLVAEILGRTLIDVHQALERSVTLTVAHSAHPDRRRHDCA